MVMYLSTAEFRSYGHPSCNLLLLSLQLKQNMSVSPNLCKTFSLRYGYYGKCKNSSTKFTQLRHKYIAKCSKITQVLLKLLRIQSSGQGRSISISDSTSSDHMWVHSSPSSRLAQKTNRQTIWTSLSQPICSRNIDLTFKDGNLYDNRIERECENIYQVTPVFNVSPTIHVTSIPQPRFEPNQDSSPVADESPSLYKKTKLRFVSRFTCIHATRKLQELGYYS